MLGDVRIPWRLVERRTRKRLSGDFVLVVQPDAERLEFTLVEPLGPIDVELVEACSDLEEVRAEFDLDAAMGFAARAYSGFLLINAPGRRPLSYAAGETVQIQFSSLLFTVS